MTALDPAFEAVLRVGLALLFVTAALHKARDLGAFRAALGGYRLLPASVLPVAAASLVALELGAALLLLYPAAGAPGVAPAGALLALYSLAIAVNLARGRRDIDCGCLGPARRRSLSPWLLGRNALLVAACLLLWLPRSARPLGWVDALSIAGGVAMAFLLWHAAHALASAAPVPRRSP